MATINLTFEQKENIIKCFSDYSLPIDNEYVIFFAKTEDFVIQIFTNKDETKFKCLITDTKIVEFCRDFEIKESQIIVKKDNKSLPEYFVCFEEQIGSDECGFGDFFGPLVAAAAYVDNETFNIITEYDISDSKKITDAKILEFIPKIISKIHYSLISVDNEKMTSLFNEGMNLNQIKSLMHNRVLNLLYKDFPHVKNVFIDQFTTPKNYYKYIETKENNIPNITFQTKGESYYPSVALASCIARYHFIKKMEELSNKYNCQIPYGASKKVDKFAKEFIDKYGIDELTKIVKTNFVNYKNLIK